MACRRRHLWRDPCRRNRKDHRDFICGRDAEKKPPALSELGRADRFDPHRQISLSGATRKLLRRPTRLSHHYDRGTAYLEALSDNSAGATTDSTPHERHLDHAEGGERRNGTQLLTTSACAPRHGTRASRRQFPREIPRTGFGRNRRASIELSVGYSRCAGSAIFRRVEVPWRIRAHSRCGSWRGRNVAPAPDVNSFGLTAMSSTILIL